MDQVRLLADDLTGALDSAAQFTGRIGPVPVYFDLPVRQPTGHGAIDAGCRDLSTAEAVVATRRLAGFLEASCAFKKIDSLLRGSWAAEIACLLETGRFRSAVLAPAFPDQGRITRAGRQWTRGPDAAWQPLEIDILASLRQVGLTPHSLQRLESGVSLEREIIIADAESIEDLVDIVARGKALPKPTLWIGSAGLARALAEVAPPQNTTVSKPVLSLIGSMHPVMQEQIERARQHDRVAFCPVTEDAARSADGIAKAFEDCYACISLFPLPKGVAPPVAAERIAKRIKKVLPLLPPFPTLVIAGGETLRAVCRASKAHWLVAEGEFNPGVPRSRVVGGRWHGQAVISKSGAFGAPDFLATLV